MALLGIITCEVLELEFAHLLRNDPEVLAVTILENQYSEKLAEIITRETKIKPQLIASLAEYSPPTASGLEVIVPRHESWAAQCYQESAGWGHFRQSQRWRHTSMLFCSAMVCVAMP